MHLTQTLHILTWILLPFAAFHALYWSAVFVQYIRTMVSIPRGRDAALRYAAQQRKSQSTTSSTPLPRICVIVPAHNEEACIELVARALLAQTYPNLHLVFALDRCTDGTEPLLRSIIAGCANAEILTISHCPPDWAGKSHALWRAAHDSPAAQASDILVFLDADTIPTPDCIGASASLMQSRSLSLLSLLSTLTCDKPFEKVAQPAAVFELMRQFPIVRANSPDGKRPFANGQFIMVKRADYLAFGGHDAIRWAVLEDVELARQAARHNFRCGVFVADELLTCRMYSNAAEFAHGWSRIYRESCNNRPSRLRTFAWRSRLLCCLLPALTLASLLVNALTLAIAPHQLAPITLTLSLYGLGMWLTILALCYVAMRIPPLWIFTFPIGSWQVSNILMTAAAQQARNEPIRWGGREYIRNSR